MPHRTVLFLFLLELYYFKNSQLMITEAFDSGQNGQWRHKCSFFINFAT